MRVYEFAKKTGATCATVLRLADEVGVEVYSPVGTLEADEVEALHAAVLKYGPEKIKAEAAENRQRRQAKAAAAAERRAEAGRRDAVELENARQRAIAAAEGRPAPKAGEMPPPAPTAKKKTAAKAHKSDIKDLSQLGGGDAAESAAPVAPKVSIEVADAVEGEENAPAPEEDAPRAVSRREEDDDEDMDYFHGKDRDAITSGKTSSAAKSAQKQNAAKAEKPEAPAKAAKPAAPAKVVKPVAPAKPAVPAKPVPAPAPAAKPVTRVGGLRAGFQSVSMRTTRPQAAGGVKISAGIATAPAAPAKPTISLSVSSREISIRGAVVVKELAVKLGVRPNRLIADLMGLKVLASINQRVEPEVAIKVAQKYGYKVNVEHARDAANKKPVLKAIDADDEIPQDSPEQMEPRAPVVTFLGHVDHGKTTLMDFIRHAHVAAGEAGGITQQISAYQVDVQGRKITFLDTPGHSAFNAMRQRGAQLTDIAVIIIAADDGIMPQTQEAIKFARQAGVQIMVAITKCDKPTADPMRVKQMLQKEGLTPEDWGGDVVCCEVSGTTGKGVDSLLEMILLQADVLELTANPKRRANGYVIEAELEQGFGPSATMLVTGGTLKVGDAVLVGEYFGKVRSLIDDRGRRIKDAPPSTPVKVTGLSGVPEAGAEFRVMLDEKRARTLAEETARKRKEQELSQTRAASFDALMSQMGADGKHELSVVVKSDTQGSLEAIVESLRGIKSEKVSLKIINTGTGSVSLTDVKSAAAGKAMIVGFNIGCDSGVQQQARHDAVKINSFRIIYELMDYVKQSMLDLLPPEYKEAVRGHAVIKAVYDIGKVGKIAGSQMLDGTLVASARYRVRRGNETIWEGKLQSLKHFKDEVKEVTGQQECGVHFAGFEKFAENDVIECYVLEELPRSL